MNPDDLTNEEHSREEMAFLTEELRYLKNKLVREHKLNVRAEITHHGEKPGGIWKMINNPKRLRDLIPRLIIPNTTLTQYEKSLARMAELARNEYKALQ